MLLGISVMVMMKNWISVMNVMAIRLVAGAGLAVIVELRCGLMGGLILIMIMINCSIIILINDLV